MGSIEVIIKADVGFRSVFILKLVVMKACCPHSCTLLMCLDQDFSNQGFSNPDLDWIGSQGPELSITELA